MSEIVKCLDGIRARREEVQLRDAQNEITLGSMGFLERGIDPLIVPSEHRQELSCP